MSSHIQANDKLRHSPRRLGSILIVDDQVAMRILLKRILEKHGHSVTMAASGPACLRFLGSGHFDLILLDIMMPGMDGMEVLRAVRQRYTSDELPVIMVTVQDGQADREAALAAGANDYLVKPLDFLRLLESIENCIPESRGAAGHRD